MEDNEKITTKSTIREPLVKPLEAPVTMHKNIIYLAVVAAIVLGVVTGFSLGGQKTSNPTAGNQTALNTAGNSNKPMVGSADTKTFKDCAIGELGKNDGKVTEEGSHKLTRPGGENQSVYLTSSVLDLDEFIGKQVEVCGETHQAQKAGWLLDVGRVQLQ